MSFMLIWREMERLMNNGEKNHAQTQAHGHRRTDRDPTRTDMDRYTDLHTDIDGYTDPNTDRRI